MFNDYGKFNLDHDSSNKLDGDNYNSEETFFDSFKRDNVSKSLSNKSKDVGKDILEIFKKPISFAWETIKGSGNFSKLVFFSFFKDKEEEYEETVINMGENIQKSVRSGAYVLSDVIKLTGDASLALIYMALVVDKILGDSLGDNEKEGTINTLRQHPLKVVMIFVITFSLVFNTTGLMDDMGEYLNKLTDTQTVQQVERHNMHDQSIEKTNETVSNQEAVEKKVNVSDKSFQDILSKIDTENKGSYEILKNIRKTLSSKDLYAFDSKDTAWDQNEDKYFSSVINEPKENIQVDGINLIKDKGGLWFYKVQSGDTLSSIKDRLEKLEQFDYLKDTTVYTSTGRLKSFNVSPSDLRPGMLLPVPIDPVKKNISSDQYMNYFLEGVSMMSVDPNYKEDMSNILEQVKVDDLLVLMYTLAKQESLLGTLSFYRWEPKYISYSYSLFHILMSKGSSGLKARKKLGLTEGQILHPTNSARLLLGFMIDKMNNSDYELKDFFPLDKESNRRALAKFFNGRKWESFNPHYTDNIKTYINEAIGFMPKKEDQQQDIIQIASNDVP